MPSRSLSSEARLAIVAVVFVGLLVGGVAVANASDAEVVLPDDTVVAGQETTLVLEVTHRADGVGDSMQGVIVRLDEGDAPLTVRTAGESLGNVPIGATRTVTFDVVVDDDAEPGTYEMELEVDHADGTETIDVEITVEERAKFTVVDVKTDVHVGEPGTVELELENVGTDAARNTTVELQAPDPGFDIGGATTFSRTFAGEWEQGETRTLRVAARASGDTEARPHAIDLSVRFYDDLGVRRSDDPRQAGVEVGPPQEFRIGNVSSTLRVGEDGRLTATLKNYGDRQLKNATAVLESPNPNVNVRDAEQFVGTLDPGETAEIAYQVGLTDDAEAGERNLPFVVRYRTPGDEVVFSDQVDLAGVEVAPAQEFEITDAESTLQVGKDGTVNATIVNRADRTVENAVAILESPNPNVDVRDPEWFLGTLGPNESTEASFRVGLREDAEPGDRVLPLVVRYRTPYEDNVLSDQLDVPVSIDEAIDPFAIEAVDETIAQGETIRYEVIVENVGTERYTDIEAQLFANPPLSTTDDEAYIAELEPGETEVIAFGIEADDDATPKTYPLSVDFRYEDEVGDRYLTDRLRLPVEVEESELSPIVIGMVLLLVAVLAAIGYWQRDRIVESIDDVRSG